MIERGDITELNFCIIGEFQTFKQKALGLVQNDCAQTHLVLAQNTETVPSSVVALSLTAP